MFREIPWPTVFLLGLIGLIRPLLSITGLFDAVGPAGSLIVSIGIAAIWIAFAVRMRVQQPVLMLAAAGAVYAVLSILFTVVVFNFFPEASGEAPVSLSLLTAGLAGALIMNVIWGVFLGLTSQVILRMTNPRLF
jgi:hypothetical protein